jgi:xylose isomerase
VAFEFFRKLDIPFYCFHDVDVMAEADGVASHRRLFAEAVEHLARLQEETGRALLWGTANLFSHPRYAAGAATNPDPEVFAFAAMQVRDALEATHRLGGANYVLWGGREGYDTLLNTDLSRELEQLGRFLNLVVEHKHKIGFAGAILIEPKPHEPTKHQYDFDVATVYGFLRRHGLETEVKLNIEANHATLAGHSFEHEIALAQALGVFGSIDANRGDPQNGWDTDQFPNSVEEMTLAMLEILREAAQAEPGSGRSVLRACRRDRCACAGDDRGGGHYRGWAAGGTAHPALCRLAGRIRPGYCAARPCRHCRSCGRAKDRPEACFRWAGAAGEPCEPVHVKKVCSSKRL